MFVSISVLGGLFLMGYGIACVRAKQAAEKWVRMEFGLLLFVVPEAEAHSVEVPT